MKVYNQRTAGRCINKAKLKEKAGLKSLLGQTLVEMGYCTEDDISRVVAKQSGVRLLTVSNFKVDMAAANLVTPEIAEKYKALPIGFENNRLLLAMKNPSDVIAIDDLRIITGYVFTCWLKDKNWCSLSV